MMRFLLPLIFIAVAVFGYFKFTTPVLSEIDGLRAQRNTLNTALDNARKLRNVQESLLAAYRALPPEDLARLDKFLPDNVDNVRLIIDINNIARRSGMSIRNIKINTEGGQSEASVINDEGTTTDLGTVSLGFSVAGSYQNFQAFLQNLARSLRLVDVSATTLATGNQGDGYTYGVTIKTYWLK